MDFWKPYIGAAAEKLTNAEIVYDKFHIMKQMNTAVDAVRAKEHRQNKRVKDITLTGTKYIWLKNPANFNKKDKKRWADLSPEMDRLKVKRAWDIREKLRRVWETDKESVALKRIARWYREAIAVGLEPVRKVAEMIKAHISGIMSYWRHRVTNGFAEGMNGIIQEIKTVARGFRSFRNYRTAILFYCGKLDLYPH